MPTKPSIYHLTDIVCKFADIFQDYSACLYTRSFIGTVSAKLTICDDKGAWQERRYASV